MGKRQEVVAAAEGHQVPVIPIGDGLLSLRTLHLLDEALEASFDRLLMDLVEHCRKFETSDAARELVLSLSIAPGDNAGEAKVFAVCEAKYPKVKTVPVDVELLRNKSSQLLLPM